MRRTRDPELRADLMAETFACALEGLAGLRVSRALDCLRNALRAQR